MAVHKCLGGPPRGGHQIRIDRDRIDAPLFARLEVGHTAVVALALRGLADIVVGDQVRRDDKIARQQVGTVSTRAAIVHYSPRGVTADNVLCAGRGADHPHTTRSQHQRLVF